MVVKLLRENMTLVSIVRTFQKSETLSGWGLPTLRDGLKPLATAINGDWWKQIQSRLNTKRLALPG
ncbi:MAG: hypothetical protein EA366_13190 [Spirulina sp. DLM2.Bin59]|nr:MAG: hypothetical protein EA366_13190 [Spirulina sp. DLM2.Bin59]